jgi:hypothetical protein
MMQRRRTFHDEFQAAFYDNLSKNSPRQAFDKTEEIFKRDYGISPYSGFDSFRISQIHRQKRKNQKGRS